uniref:MARVEL domain-containing protein n=1 Tax=Strongyloides stercoralis TaxID=6248 RepID=A0A0K0EFA6_STRER
MSSLHSFQPNGKMYKTFCFHVKNVSMVVGMIEILFICILLIGVPEISLHLCNCSYKNNSLKTTTLSKINYGTNYITTQIPKKAKRDMNNITSTTSLITTTTSKHVIIMSTTTQLYNSLNNNTNNNSGVCYEIENIIEKKIIVFILCNMDIVWLFIALLHIIFVNLFIYGIKSTKPKTIIPYLVTKIFFLSVLLMIIILSIIILAKSESTYDKSYQTIHVNKVIFGILIFAFIIMLYTIVINFFTYHFVKRSFETGYSISAARPFAQPSGSISDQLRQSRDAPFFDNNRNQINRIEMVDRNQAKPSDDNIIYKKSYPTTSNNQTPKVLPPLRHTFRPNTANRLPEK